MTSSRSPLCGRDETSVEDERSSPVPGRSRTTSISTSFVADCSEQTTGKCSRQRRRQRSSSLSTLLSVTRQLSVATPVQEENGGYHSSTTQSADVTASEADEDEGRLMFCSMSHDKKLTVVNFCLTNLCAGCFYSMLGPFFPSEAAKKGLSSLIVGFIFGMFELTIVLASPVLGRFITQIGAKFMYIAGVMVCGCGAILFGFLDRTSDGTVYAVMCFLVRFVEALGAAGLTTSSFAIMAHTFPHNVATMFGSLELFSGLGLMIGPIIGGGLFQLGGFLLPFVSLGAILLIVGLASIFILPAQEVIRMQSSHSMFGLLKIPIISIMGICLMSASASIGFFDVGLSIFLTEEYNLSPVVLGAVFLAGPGGYALSAPLWGWIVDRTTRYSKIFIVCGYTISGISFFLMGPAPFLPIPHMLWTVILTVSLVGFGTGTAVITFQIIADATLEKGYPESLDTYGLIAGVFNSFYSFGAFIGPLGGGYLMDVFDFQMSAVVIGSCCLLAAALLAMHTIMTSVHCQLKSATEDAMKCSTSSRSSSSEKQPLINTGHGHTESHADGLYHNHVVTHRRDSTTTIVPYFEVQNAAETICVSIGRRLLTCGANPEKSLPIASSDTASTACTCQHNY